LIDRSINQSIVVADHRRGERGAIDPMLTTSTHFWSRRFVVRIPRCAIVVAIMSAVFVVGCGDGEENKPVDLKPADTSNFKDMMDQQTKGLKGGNKPPKSVATPTPPKG
jgi:hypothetical protein